VGEFLIILGAFQFNTFIALFAASGIILGAIYMLYLYKNIIFGVLTCDKVREILDLETREKLIMYPIIIMVIIIGVFPNIFLESIHMSVELIISNYEIANGK
jgi:NADH-quinone oxidoreductase subunit M